MEFSPKSPIRDALTALEAGRIDLSEFERVVETAMTNGSLAPGADYGLLHTALRGGLIHEDSLSRLGIDLGPGADRTRYRSEDQRTRGRIASDAIPPPELDHVTTGSILGRRYLLERELGSGGMGVVFFARDEEVPGEVYAIKVLNPEVREIPASLDLMREEVRKTRALAHPNIVGVYSLNMDGPTAYILMEYLEGKTLTALIDDDFGRGMPFLRAWPPIQDVCSALAHAHDHSVIHCDLKPSNIFITTAGKAKLLDFGIAQAARGGAGHFDTASLGALTEAYASCDMLEQRPPEQRDDIYSLACVLYEMLSGRHPFDRRSSLDAREAGLKMPRIASLSRRQNTALARALAFDRGKRTPSVEALQAGLAPNRRTGIVWAMAAILALGAGVAGWLWTSRREPTPEPQTASAPQKDSAPQTASAPPPGAQVAAAQPGASLAPPSETRPLQSSTNPCNAPLTRGTLERVLNAGMDASARAALMSTGSREAEEATALLRSSVDCLRALRAEGIASPDSDRFLHQVRSMLTENP
jgi:serine/threonine protein kinase